MNCRAWQDLLQQHLDGLGPPEALDRPVGTIKTWLHRARLEILERLRRRGMLPDEGTSEGVPGARNERGRG